MRRIHPSLEKARIEFTNQLVQTVAGKTPMVVLDDTTTAPVTNQRAPVSATAPAAHTAAR
jgi:hypothetical protein